MPTPDPGPQPGHHLAHLNVAAMGMPLDDPRMAGFTGNLDRINALAEASPGFVWRLLDDSGAATALRIPGHDDLLVNLTLWQDVASLRHFTWQTDHAAIMARRREWFEPLPGPHLVLWWLPEGVLPSLADAGARLRQLAEQGPSPAAFTFREPFPLPA